MTLIGHLGGSLMAACAVERGLFGRRPTPEALGLAVLMAVLPDADGLLAVLIGRVRPGRERLPHHGYPTHTPAFYLLLALGVGLLAGAELAVLLAALALTHLALDSWGTDDGVMWLWPASARQWAVFPTNLHVDGLFGWRYYWRYARQWRAVAPELLLAAGGVLLCLLC